MKIRILGWQSSGLRCADVPVALHKGKNIPKATLIQMPNGTGKTTSLELLKGTLTGEIIHWGEEKILSFREPGAENEKGSFILDLDVDSQPLTFEVEINFESLQVNFRTVSPLIGGFTPGYQPPIDVRRFLEPKFVGLFIFDGELAGKMLEHDQTRASDAIDTLCQLDLIEKVKAVLDAKWNSVQSGAGGKGNPALTRNRNSELKLIQSIQTYKTMLGEAEERIKNGQAQLKAREKEFTELFNASTAFGEQRDKIKNEINEKSLLIKEEMGRLVAVLRNPVNVNSAFRNSLILLKNNLDTLKLPDSTSRQFFLELADEKLCVCGREIKEENKQIILKEANKYLGDDITGIVNMIKQDIENVRGGAPGDPLSLADRLSIINGLKTEIELLDTDLKDLERRNADNDKSLRLKELLDERSELERQLQRDEDMKDELCPTHPVHNEGEGSSCIQCLEKELGKVRAEIAKITETVDLRKKIDVIVEWLNVSRTTARERLKEIIIGECNQHLRRILAASPLHISKIDNHIMLGGQAGASAGQTLAVGYTYISTLLNRGAHELPLVVDSPAGPLDDLVRQQIGQMVPKLCKQFVTFMTNTEREDFLPALQNACEGDIRYLTIYRRNEKTNAVRLDGVNQASVVDTGKYILIEDKDFFEKFSIADA